MLPAEMGLLGWVVTGFTAALFLAAALHKRQDPMLFYAQLDAYGLLPAPWSWYLSNVLPWLELLLALSLFVPGLSMWAASACAMLLSLYATAMAMNLLRGRTDLDCGCGGQAARISWKLVMRNALMALAIGLVPYVQVQSIGFWNAVIAAGCGFLIWMVYALYEKVRSMLAGNHLISAAKMK